MSSKVTTLSLLIIVGIASSQSEETQETNYETLLLDTIFKDYDARTRPVKNFHTPVLVNFSLTINQIIQVDEKHQRITLNLLRKLLWKDEFLNWTPENFGNITRISTSRSVTWTPDIQLYNSATFGKGSDGVNTKNVINHDGVVVDAIYAVFTLTCKIDVTWFPFDEQKCSLIFGSWSLTSKYLIFQLRHLAIDDGLFIDNGEWKLLGVSATSSNQLYACCPDQPFIRIICTIHLKRRAFYFFFNLLVPCGLIGFLAILGFTLLPESGEKLSLGATILFSLIVFLNMISETMPANSDAVPLLGTYFNCIMFTIAFSVVSTIVVNLKLNTGNPTEVKGSSKKLFLCWLPRLLCMKRSPNVVRERDVEKRIGDAITLHPNGSRSQESVITPYPDHVVELQWKYIAAVVDRLCLIFSIIVTLVSVAVFSVYAF